MRLDYLREHYIEMQSNILRIYAEANASERAQGADWYPLTRDICAEWSRDYSLPADTVACVIAAISPQCEWQTNLRTAKSVCAREPLQFGRGAIVKNILKAERIRDNGATNPREYFPFGPKVCSFAANMQGNDYAVTVDVHAFQIALLNPTVYHGLKWKQYTLIAECYRAAADLAQLTPCTLQAITWLTWKRLFPRRAKVGIKRNLAKGNLLWEK